MAYMLTGSIYERQQRVEDAMAAYVELKSKFGTSASAPEATYRLANLTLRSKRNDKELAAIALLDEVVKVGPKSPFAPRALTQKATLEDEEKIRVLDSQLNTSVPAGLVSIRTLVEKYPDAENAEVSLDRLARYYEDLKRYELSAQTLDILTMRFPANGRDAAWRAAEMYEKRLKDMDRARAAYAQVPEKSGHYRDAQKKVQQR